MRKTDREPEYEFEWLSIPFWVIVAVIIIGGSC